LTKIGTFDIKESFNITLRGIVLVGYCNNCIPKTGMWVSLILRDRIEIFKITGISMGNRPKDNKDQFGLLIQTTSATKEYISENKINNHSAELLQE